MHKYLRPILTLSALAVMAGFTLYSLPGTTDEQTPDNTFNRTFEELFVKASQQFSAVTPIPEELKLVSTVEETNPTTDELLTHLQQDPFVATANYHQADNEEAVAIVFLQRHKAPGSNNDDSVNDVATLVQKDMAMIMKDLNEQFGINQALVEGKHAGEQGAASVNSELDIARQHGQKLSQLHKVTEALLANGELSSTQRTELQKTADAFFEREERKLLLEGAAIYLWANGTNLHIVGAENPDTYAQSATIVKSYMYLSNQIQQLAQSGSHGNTSLSSLLNEQLNLQDLELLEQLLNRRSSTSATDTFLLTLDTLLQEMPSNDIQSYAQEASTLTQDIASINIAPTVIEGLKPTTQTENRYGDITDIDELQTELKRVESEMTDVVINQRNTDTAENFYTMMTESETNAGMLLFGAQHEEGLIQELLDRNVTVIAITTESLAQARR